MASAGKATLLALLTLGSHAGFALPTNPTARTTIKILDNSGLDPKKYTAWVAGYMEVKPKTKTDPKQFYILQDDRGTKKFVRNSCTGDACTMTFSPAAGAVIDVPDTQTRATTGSRS